jgi:hypothetical protein
MATCHFNAGPKRRLAAGAEALYISPRWDESAITGSRDGTHLVLRHLSLLRFRFASSHFHTTQTSLEPRPNGVSPRRRAPPPGDLLAGVPLVILMRPLAVRLQRRPRRRPRRPMRLRQGIDCLCLFLSDGVGPFRQRWNELSCSVSFFL